MLFCQSKSTVGHFNSLAPCGANLFIVTIYAYIKFISTHSPRAGRTVRRTRLCPKTTNFNSLAPCGANPNRRNTTHFCGRISTHSPRAGRTIPNSAWTIPAFNFNSLAPCGANRRSCRSCGIHSGFQLTRPVRGEPLTSRQAFGLRQISTHSPRAGRTISTSDL